MKLLEFLKKIIQAPIKAWKKYKRDKAEAEKEMIWMRNFLINILLRRQKIHHFKSTLPKLGISSIMTQEELRKADETIYYEIVINICEEFYSTLLKQISISIKPVEVLFQKKKYSNIIKEGEKFKENIKTFLESQIKNK